MTRSPGKKTGKKVKAWAVIVKEHGFIMQNSFCGPYEIFRRRRDARQHVSSVCYEAQLEVVRVEIRVVR